MKLTAGRDHLGVHFSQLFVLVQFTFYTWAVQGIGQKAGNCKRDTHTEPLTVKCEESFVAFPLMPEHVSSPKCFAPISNEHPDSPASAM